jgi:hypothetical protein
MYAKLASVAGSTVPAMVEQATVLLVDLQLRKSDGTRNYAPGCCRACAAGSRKQSKINHNPMSEIELPLCPSRQPFLCSRTVFNGAWQAAPSRQLSLAAVPLSPVVPLPEHGGRNSRVHTMNGCFIYTITRMVYQARCDNLRPSFENDLPSSADPAQGKIGRCLVVAATGRTL